MGKVLTALPIAGRYVHGFTRMWPSLVRRPVEALDVPIIRVSDVLVEEPFYVGVVSLWSWRTPVSRFSLVITQIDTALTAAYGKDIQGMVHSGFHSIQKVLQGHTLRWPSSV